MFNSTKKLRSSKPLALLKLAEYGKKRLESSEILKKVTKLDSKAAPSFNEKTSALMGSRLALCNFQKEFGEVKSGAYLSLMAKKLKEAGADDSTICKTFKTERMYLSKARIMRKEVWFKKHSDFDEYISTLKQYLIDFGTYMDSVECADITLYSLLKQGIPSKNVTLNIRNLSGKTSDNIEHVFTLAGINKNFNERNPMSWGKEAIICDAWINKAMPADIGLDFYKKLFNFNPKTQRLAFAPCSRFYSF